MKHFYRFLAISFFLFGIVSCSNSYDNPNPNPTTNTITFTAVLNGTNAGRPGNVSPAAGTATLMFNDATNKFTITVTHNVVDANAAHIHTTESVPAGEVVFPLTNTSSTTYSYTTPDPITSVQEAALKAEHYYVNVHSPTYPGPLLAEISGPLLKQGSTGGGGGGGY
jgi:hypothetical protein